MSNFNHIVCPHCSSINRISVQRLREKPICGECKQKLFIGCPVKSTEPLFLRHISCNDIPVVVLFGACWSNLCRDMIPIFKHTAMLFEPDARFIKVDSERERALAEKYNIRSMPTFVLFKNGVETARQFGAMSGNDLVLWLHSQIVFKNGEEIAQESEAKTANDLALGQKSQVPSKNTHVDRRTSAQVDRRTRERINLSIT